MSKQETKKRGQYGNVLLSDQEVEKLKEDFGTEVTEETIDFLDKYIKENDYNPKDHNLAIRKWVADIVKEEMERRPRKEMVAKVIELLKENDLTIRDAIGVLGDAKKELYKLAHNKKI